MVKQSTENNLRQGSQSENNQESHREDSQLNKQVVRRKELKKMVADRFHLDAGKRSYREKQKRLKEKAGGRLLQAICREDTFLCSICCEVMVGPTIIECGHSFCVECAEKYSNYNLTCPICRNIQDMNEYTVSEITERLIKKFVSECMSEQQQERYNKRVAEFQGRQTDRRVEGLKDCYLLDFKDVKSRCWKKGIVQEVDEKNKIAKISPIENPHQVHRIHVKSRNLAKDEYYTGTLEEYQVKLQSENMQTSRNYSYQDVLTFIGFSSISFIRNGLYQIDMENGMYEPSRRSPVQLRPIVGRGIISPQRSANRLVSSANSMTELQSSIRIDISQQADYNSSASREEERR